MRGAIEDQGTPLKPKNVSTFRLLSRLVQKVEKGRLARRRFKTAMSRQSGSDSLRFLIPSAGEEA